MLQRQINDVVTLILWYKPAEKQVCTTLRHDTLDAWETIWYAWRNKQIRTEMRMNCACMSMCTDTCMHVHMHRYAYAKGPSNDFWSTSTLSHAEHAQTNLSSSLLFHTLNFPPLFRVAWVVITQNFTSSPQIPMFMSYASCQHATDAVSHTIFTNHISMLWIMFHGLLVHWIILLDFSTLDLDTWKWFRTLTFSTRALPIHIYCL